MNRLSLLAVLCLSGSLWITANAQCCEKADCCPDGWISYEDRCFYYVAQAEDFATAEKKCVALCGNLVSIHSRPELEFIEEFLRRTTLTDKRIWTGGTDSTKEGTWVWTDGSPFKFHFWGPPNPNNGGGTEDCMELNWRKAPNDHQCYHKKPYMCARDK